MEYLVLLWLIHGNMVIARALQLNVMRFTTALSTYQAAPVRGSRAEYSATLTRHILNGDPDAAIECVAANTDAVQRTLHAETANGAIDLRAILAGTD